MSTRISAASSARRPNAGSSAEPGRHGEASAGRPSRTGNPDPGTQHLPLPRSVAAEPGHARPPGRDHVEAPTVRPTEHAREAAAVEWHGIEHAAAFGHPYAVLMRHIRVPRRALGIEADAVRR